MVRDIERRRLWVISPESPGLDPDVEPQFSDIDSAAILVGRDPAYILSLGIRHHGSEDDLMVLLETIRAAVGLKLREEALASQLRQAQAIQQSLLPRRLPELAGFDLAAVTIPADEVGGDVYDVQRVEAGVLGLMLADASGHGLPAALQARDVVIGLRMGQAQNQKITATVSQPQRRDPPQRPLQPLHLPVLRRARGIRQHGLRQRRPLPAAADHAGGRGLRTEDLRAGAGPAAGRRLPARLPDPAAGRDAGAVHRRRHRAPARGQGRRTSPTSSGATG